MTEEQRLTLKMVSGLLEYPGHTLFRPHLQERAALANSLDARIEAVMATMVGMDPWALEKLYVASFDFDAQRSLYLTAHEMGDSRDRGQALIELTDLYRQSGCEVPDDELADFLPLLLEWMAVYSESVTAPLAERVAQVCTQIAQHLNADHLYRPLFEAIVDTLGVPESTPTASVEEHPDLVDLPYPVE